MKLEELASGQSLSGIEPADIVSVVALVPLAEDSVQLIYRRPDGAMKERLLGRADEASIAIASSERPFSFDGDGAVFQLACEAKRIDLTFLFDPMMAVHTSNVEPLPHQITAVYESLLPRQPLRFVLADDPGAGKTIMARLYIRELIIRADSHRILIIVPGSLVEQWRDELFEKFGLEFHIYSPLLEQASPSVIRSMTTRSSSSASISSPATKSCRRSSARPAGIWRSSMKRTSSPLITSAQSWKRRRASALRRNLAHGRGICC